MRVIPALELLLSNRRRFWKLAASLGLVALLTAGFQARPGAGGPTFARLASGDSARYPAGLTLGPESLRVVSLAPRVISAVSYGVPLEILLGGGAAGERAATAAAALHAGEWVAVRARHLGGPRFEAVELTPKPYRWMKLAVSGVAALAVAAAFPWYFRRSRGGLTARCPRGER